jgi:hypothetical protein
MADEVSLVIVEVRQFEDKRQKQPADLRSGSHLKARFTKLRVQSPLPLNVNV